MSYVACLLAFGLYYVVKRYLPRRLSRTPGIGFVPFILLAIGVMTLADTIVGSWVSGYLIEPVLGFLGGSSGCRPRCWPRSCSCCWRPRRSST